MDQAKSEIDESLKFTTFCMRGVGLFFDKPKTFSSLFLRKLTFLLSLSCIIYHVFGDFVHLTIVFSTSPQFEDIIPVLHLLGYAFLSLAKISSLWLKIDVYGQLIVELAEIWPVSLIDEEANAIKTNSLSNLNFVHKWYFIVSINTVCLYCLTPLIIGLWQLAMEGESQIGFIWMSWYPFDRKYSVYVHIAVYSYEVFIGVACVLVMVATDLLFSAMASHISMLLKILQHRLQSFGTTNQSEQENYQEMVSIIKLHQRLIRYCNDLENVFSFPNLMNVLLSSVNICCVAFVIVFLEPFLILGSKVFLISILVEMAMLCWYADDVFHANAELATAAYNSEWYNVDPKCRKLLLMLMRRAQKPLAFTAMKFTNISLVTYSSILVRSYSYFTLLYTVYQKN